VFIDDFLYLMLVVTLGQVPDVVDVLCSDYSLKVSSIFLEK